MISKLFRFIKRDSHTPTPSRRSYVGKGSPPPSPPAKTSLLRSHCFELVQVLYSSGIEPYFPLIEWTAATRSYSSTDMISFKDQPRRFRFWISPHHDYFNVEYFPSEKMALKTSRDHELSWDQVKTHFKDWLSNVRHELETPEPWDDIVLAASNFTRFTDQLAATTDLHQNEFFNSREQEQIARNLEYLSKKISNELSIDEDQVAEMNRKLDHLQDSLIRQSKVDWLHTFVGAAVSISVSLSLTSDDESLFWSIIKEWISNPIGGLLELL